MQEVIQFALGETHGGCPQAKLYDRTPLLSLVHPYPLVNSIRDSQVGGQWGQKGFPDPLTTLSFTKQRPCQQIETAMSDTC